MRAISLAHVLKEFADGETKSNEREGGPHPCHRGSFVGGERAFVCKLRSGVQLDGSVPLRWVGTHDCFARVNPVKCNHLINHIQDRGRDQKLADIFPRLPPQLIAIEIEGLRQEKGRLVFARVPQSGTNRKNASDQRLKQEALRAWALPCGRSD